MIVLRSLLALALIAVPVAAAAQGAATAAPAVPPAPQPMPPGLEPPALTQADVEKLVLIIPELARESASVGKGGGKMAAPAPGMPPMAVEDLERIGKLLGKHGFRFPDFFSKMTALVSTYMVLRPEELERRLPTEQSPEVRTVLDDPAVPEAQKQALRDEIRQAHENKEVVRAQLGVFATPENRRVVTPMLAQVQKALEQAEAATRAARQTAPAPRPAGPRR